MQKQKLNGEMTVSWPDEFRVMSESEMKRMYPNDAGRSWGIQGGEPNITMTCVWWTKNRILMWLADLKTSIKSLEMKTRKAYAGHEYHLDGFFSTTVADLNAEGFRFTFADNDKIVQVETLIVKMDKCYYTFSCIARKELAEKMHAAFEALLSSAVVEKA